MIKIPLPIRDGITASRLYFPKGSWRYLIDFLIERFPHLPVPIIQERLRQGDMVDANGKPYHALSRYTAESWGWYYRKVEDEIKVPFSIDILYQDDVLVAVDKPHFLATTPGGRYLHETVLIRLRKQLNDFSISPIHRLDRDTAGVILLCKQARYRGAYQSLFQSRQVQKTYECIAPFKEDICFPLLRESYIEKSASYFTMQERQPLGERVPNSATHIALIKHNKEHGHYVLCPLSGKKHQLRVHMSGLGLAIYNDESYPFLLPYRDEGNFENPLQLLARSIAFTDPVTKEQRYFESNRQLARLDLFDLSQ